MVPEATPPPLFSLSFSLSPSLTIPPRSICSLPFSSRICQVRSSYGSAWFRHMYMKLILFTRHFMFKYYKKKRVQGAGWTNRAVPVEQGWMYNKFFVFLVDFRSGFWLVTAQPPTPFWRRRWPGISLFSDKPIVARYSSTGCWAKCTSVCEYESECVPQGPVLLKAPINSVSK